MIPPVEEHEMLKRIDNIEKVAYERLFTNYLQLNLKGDKKLIDITSTNQESIATKIATVIPGMIYTFIHLNPQNLAVLENMKTGNLIEFHDFTPILFCTSYNSLHKQIKGLNLNMLPPNVRLNFLQAFWEMFREFFERVEEKTEYQQSALNMKYISEAMSGKNPQIIKAFNHKFNSLFNFAYRSYNISNLKNYRMLEYEEWKYIPFFNAKNAFKKINLSKVYDLYNTNKNKTL